MDFFIPTMDDDYIDEEDVQFQIAATATMLPAPTAFTTSIIGQYRIQNLSAVGYLIYVGVNGLPDFTAAPYAIVATLPASINYPLANQTLYIVPRLRNSYGVISQNQHPFIITLTAGGVINNPVTAPSSVQGYANSSGTLRILCRYPLFLLDVAPATNIKIWVSLAPTIPNPAVDVPAYVAPINADTIISTFGNYTPGTYNVAVGFFRQGDATISATVALVIIVPVVPAEPEGVSTVNVTLP